MTDMQHTASPCAGESEQIEREDSDTTTTGMAFDGTLPASFSEMREAEELVDVYLVFNGKLVPCHKVILAGNCEYFKRMFLSKMNESSAREVNLKGINATHGELVVDYLYSKDIEITEDNAQGLLEASSLLMLDKLKKKVEHFLIGQLEAENCVSILNVARFYQLETLLETSLKFLCDRLHKIIDTMELEELTKDDLVNVLENHATKEACFSLLQKWLKCKNGDADDFTDMLRHVNLARCSKEFIQTTVLNEQMLASPRGLQIIQNALIAGQALAPGKSLVVGDQRGGFWVHCDGEDWKSVPKTCTRFVATCFSACSFPNGIIFSGGLVAGKPVSHVFTFSAQDQDWRILPAMTRPRFFHSSIYHDANLYVIGGRLTDTAYSDSVEVLDMKTLEWGVLSPLHRPMCHSLVASVSNRLFVIGGTPNPTSISTGVHFIESGRLNWRPRTPAPEDCRGASAATLKNKVFVVGGASNSCMAYDTLVDAWAILERPQVLFTYKASLEWNGKILLLGGTEDDSNIDEYCPIADKWSKWNLKLPNPGMVSFALRL